MNNIIDRLHKTFVDIREELIKSKKSGNSKTKGGALLTESQKRSIAVKKKTSMETRSASVPGVKRTTKGKTSLIGKQLGAKKIKPKKKKHVVAQHVRTIKSPTKRVSIVKKMDEDVYTK